MWMLFFMSFFDLHLTCIFILCYTVLYCFTEIMKEKTKIKNLETPYKSRLFKAFILVAEEGLEPTTFGLWARRATNCSTPRRILNCYAPSSSEPLHYTTTNCFVKDKKYFLRKKLTAHAKCIKIATCLIQLRSWKKWRITRNTFI